MDTSILSSDTGMDEQNDPMRPSFGDRLRVVSGCLTGLQAYFAGVQYPGRVLLSPGTQPNGVLLEIDADCLESTES